MNLKRAVWISILLYLSTFVIGILVAFVLNTDLTGNEPISITHWVLSIILSLVLASLFSLWYFKGKKIKINSQEGLKLGITFIIVGFIFDMLFILPYLFLGFGDADAILSYYKDIWFWISVILIALTPVVVGSIKKK